MNKKNLLLIFEHYIERFDELNNPQHEEYYKWQIAKRFRSEMDAALKAPAEKLASELYKVVQLSCNLIDSYTTPFYGLTKLAEKEPETVRSMFLNLFCEDGGDLTARQKRVREFLWKSHELREKYFPGSFLYKNDVHSVTGYLFLYDPDHNYLYKATHGRAFADCIEFYDDWGSGDTVALDVYYHMCDLIVKEIKNCKRLLEADATRFHNRWEGVEPDSLYADQEKHILTFDLIYCCSTYGLLHGITYEKKSSKELKQIQEGKKKASELCRQVQDARADADLLEDAKQYLESAFRTGMTIHHRVFGTGIITKVIGEYVTLDFPDAGKKTFVSTKLILEGLIDLDSDEEKFSKMVDVLKRESSIGPTLSAAEKNFAEYAEYLD